MKLFDYIVIVAIASTVILVSIFSLNGTKDEKENNDITIKQEEKELTEKILLEKEFVVKEFKISDDIYSDEKNSFILKRLTNSEVIIQGKSNNGEVLENIYPSNLNTFFELGSSGVFLKIKEFNPRKGTVTFYLDNKNKQED